MRMLIVLFVSLFTSRLVLRNLGTVDFGLYNVVGGLIAMMNFISASLALGYDRFLNIKMGECDLDGYHRVFSVAMWMQLILALLCFLLAETIGLWFLNTQMTIPSERIIAANIIFQVALFMFILELFRGPLNAVLISYSRMDIYAYISLFSTFAKLLIAGCLSLVATDRLVFYALLLLLISFIAYWICFLFVKRIDNGITLRPIYDMSFVKEMTNFSVWNLFGTMANVLKENGLNILLNIFFGPVVNAARGVAYQVSGAVDGLYTNFQMAARPQLLQRYASGEIEKMEDLFSMVSRLSFMLLWIITLPILYSTEFILTIWLGEDWPLYSALFVRIVMMISLVAVFSGPISTIVHATGKMKVYQVISGSVLMLIVPIAYIILKIGGAPVSVFYVSLVLTTVVLVIRIFILRSLIPFSIKKYVITVLLRCLFVIIISVIVSLGIRALPLNDWTRFFLYLIVCFASVLAIGVTKKERLMAYEWVCAKVSKQKTD